MESQPLFERGYESFAELLEVPDALVIVGTVTGVTDVQLVGRGIPFTSTNVMVDEVVAGVRQDADSRTVAVRQSGGPQADGRTFVVEGIKLLDAGERVLLFLRWDPTFEAYGVTGAIYGYFVIGSDRIVRHANLDGPSDKYPGGHPLSLAVSDAKVDDVVATVRQAAP